MGIVGLGADLLTISGNHQSRVFDVATSAVLGIDGLTITGGNGVASSVATSPSMTAYGGARSSITGLLTSPTAWSRGAPRPSSAGASRSPTTRPTARTTWSSTPPRSPTTPPPTAEVSPTWPTRPASADQHLGQHDQPSNAATGTTFTAGGGIQTEAGMNLVSSTVVGNVPNGIQLGGGGTNYAAVLVDSIVDGLGGANGSFGILNASQYDLLTNPVSGGAHMIVTSSLGLAPLGDYGGPTPTFSLLLGQPRPSTQGRRAARQRPTRAGNRASAQPTSARSSRRVSRLSSSSPRRRSRPPSRLRPAAAPSPPPWSSRWCPTTRSSSGRGAQPGRVPRPGVEHGPELRSVLRRVQRRQLRRSDHWIATGSPVSPPTQNGIIGGPYTVNIIGRGPAPPTPGASRVASPLSTWRPSPPF